VRFAKGIVRGGSALLLLSAILLLFSANYLATPKRGDSLGSVFDEIAFGVISPQGQRPSANCAAN
jgi:hypothetical protein